MKDGNGREIISPVDRLVAENKERQLRRKLVVGQSAEDLKDITFWVSASGHGWHTIAAMQAAGFNINPVDHVLAKSLREYEETKFDDSDSELSRMTKSILEHGLPAFS